MAVILENSKLNSCTYKLCVQLASNENCGTSGQFFMIKASDTCDPILGRPISIFDTDETAHTVTFIYVVVGRGTELISKMHVGDNITLFGPLGRGFSAVDSDVTLIGGGVGSAPLYLFAKTQKMLYPNRKVFMHIGFSNDESKVLVEDFMGVCDNTTLNIGGYVTDDVRFDNAHIYYACGTMPMMAAACRLAYKHSSTMYVSLDKHMACGVGACLVCTCKTKDGSKKRACKDGPVFLADDVFDFNKGCFYE